MPIAKQFRKFYGREWRTVTRPFILDRDGHRCSRCGKPNRAVIYTTSGRKKASGEPYMLWQLTPKLRQAANPTGETNGWTDQDGQPSTFEPTFNLRRIIAQIGVAHLNHTPGDDRPENLAALCNWCHIVHDRGQHKTTRATRKDQARPILAALDQAAAS